MSVVKPVGHPSSVVRMLMVQIWPGKLGVYLFQTVFKEVQTQCNATLQCSLGYTALAETPKWRTGLVTRLVPLQIDLHEVKSQCHTSMLKVKRTHLKIRPAASINA